VTTNVSRSVVIAGGSFAGIAAAHTLRRSLPNATVTVIDKAATFTFAPALVDYAIGRTAQSPHFDLKRSLESAGIRYVSSAVHNVDQERRVVTTDSAELAFDVLLVATGGRPDPSSIPGMAGEWQHSHYVVGQDSAQDVANTIASLRSRQGRIVVGLAPEASYISAMYELVSGLERRLTQDGIRDRFTLTFITPEPYVGEMGIGQTAAEAELKKVLGNRDIEVRTDAKISNVGQNEVSLQSGESLDVAAVFLMPAFTGSVDIWKSAGLTDDRGFVPVNALYRHVNSSSIFAAGVASVFDQPHAPLNSTTVPHTGYLSVRMGRIAATNIAAHLGHGENSPNPLPRLLDVRVLDFGEGGLLLTSRGNHELRHHALPIPGRWGHRLKTWSATYLTWCLENGHVNWL
jgi:sulfide:quinone oxidoreductase